MGNNKMAVAAYAGEVVETSATEASHGRDVDSVAGIRREGLTAKGQNYQ